MGRTTSEGLIKSMEATVAVPARRIVAHGAADGTGVLATGPATPIRGVSSELDTAIGERISVLMVGTIAEVEAGGAVTRGDPVTADAQGRAVVAAGGNRIVGYAEVSGVLGDIITVDVLPGYAV